MMGVLQTAITPPMGPLGMQLITILNCVEKSKSYVYENARFAEDGKTIEVESRPRKGNRPVCSGCGRAGATYDHQLKPRQFQFVPLWQIAVVFVYTMRREGCHS
ncbi:MAG: hypothetical protein KDA80_00440 [Planctomycetaceae bacterium]|nr:hypothetical protein [Planctomycetaceae bacterium]